MKLITVDVEAPLPDVPAPAVGEQWVLVRLHREPLGILKFTHSGCDATRLAILIGDQFAASITRHLVADALAGGPDPLDASIAPFCPRLDDRVLPSVSVAVCTRDGAARLPDCLDAIAAVEYPRPLMEVLVVDNAPADEAVRTLVEERFPGFRYIVEPRPGLDWARNRAALEAKHEVVAFTDDDVSVDRWWVDAIGRRFAAEPEAEAVTGLVVPDEIEADPQRLFETYGGFGRGFTRQYFRVNTSAGDLTAPQFGGAGRFGTGANMAFRRRVFDRIGLFDPALDVGTPANGGGDLEMFFRVLKHGGLLIYDPSAVVRHRHRRSYEKLREQLANNGVGFFSYLVRSARAYPDERSAFVKLGAWWLWWWSVRRLARSFVRRDFPRDLILAELCGSLAGLRRYAPANARAAAVASQYGPQTTASSASGSH